MPSLPGILNYQVVRQQEKEVEIWIQPQPTQDLVLEPLVDWTESTFGKVSVRLLFSDIKVTNFPLYRKCKDKFWTSIITEGSWDTWLKQNLLPEGEIQEAALLLKQLVNPNLLKSSENVGPYKVVQQVIEESCYEAYLFQDADDCSSSDRLEKLLEKAISTGGQLVGTQEK